MIIPAGNSIIGIALALSIQVDVGEVACDRFGARQRIPEGEDCFLAEPADDKHCRIRMSASVQGQVENDVSDGAVFPPDLLIGVGDQLEGVLGGIDVFKL